MRRDLKSEAEVKQDHKDWFDEIGAYHCWPVQVGYGKRTIDCLACINGRFVGIETKKEGELEPRGHQGTTIKEILSAGGCAFVSDSIDRTKRIVWEACYGL